MCCNETKQENKMKRVSFALVFIVLLLSFGLANAGFRVEADTYEETAPECGGGEFLGTGQDIDFRVYYTNDFDMLLGWSTPFMFTGPAINGAGTHTVDPTFEALWDMEPLKQKKAGMAI